MHNNFSRPEAKKAIFERKTGKFFAFICLTSNYLQTFRFLYPALSPYDSKDGAAYTDFRGGFENRHKSTKGTDLTMADIIIKVIVSVFFIFGVYCALHELLSLAQRLVKHIRRKIDKRAKRDYNN